MGPPGRLGDFDLLYATYACLTAPWERVDPADEVGCPIAAEGWLARNGLLGEPLVHRYAALLGELLGRKPKPPAAVVLTHDVDDAFGHLFGRRERWVRLRREPSLRRAASLARDADAPRGFGPLRGLDRATDVLLRRPRRVRRRRSPGRGVRHRTPRVRETIRRLAGRGAEIGVHFSISSAGSAEEMRAERERLEEVAAVPVRSSRHHWWAQPTGRAHAEAGIDVDLSLGFNDRPGSGAGSRPCFAPTNPRPNGRQTYGRCRPSRWMPPSAKPASWQRSGRPCKRRAACSSSTGMSMRRIRAAAFRIGRSSTSCAKWTAADRSARGRSMTWYRVSWEVDDDDPLQATLNRLYG